MAACRVVWPCEPVVFLFISLGFFFFFWREFKTVKRLTDLKVLLSVKLTFRFALRRKARVEWLAYKRTSKVKFEQCFCRGRWEGIVLDSRTVSLCSNNYTSRTNSLTVKRQSILEVATTTSLIPSISDLEEHITFTKSHLSDPSLHFCASHFYSCKSLTQPNLLGFMNTNELIGGGTQANSHQTLLFSSITHDCSSLKPSVWICENQR